ncbi:hypothetical protein EVAR_16044_1 [Eumeta japonica]|uniref:Uncharacterized protein n=1 Tax=Eumeta variegata TaxID=151549 RepID=A0A4C1VXY1_EUMVA|nr:hypothetical protein EVAR_16044_1 [Eumeta japonica]
MDGYREPQSKNIASLALHEHKGGQMPSDWKYTRTLNTIMYVRSSRATPPVRVRTIRADRRSARPSTLPVTFRPTAEG